MNRIVAAGLLYIFASAPAVAARIPVYAGIQFDNTSGNILFGYQVNKTYAVEAHYTRSDTHIAHAGINADTNITTAGLAALAVLPMKLIGGSSYMLFFKAGYERISKEETYSIPSSVTLTLPYNDTINSGENRVIIGAGAQYEFYQSMFGRVGMDFVGDKRSVYLGTIYKF